MSKDTNFQFPPSPQSDLFNYLRPEQQEFVKPILRVLKKTAQEELCCALLDYLEKGIELPPVDFTLSGLFIYITRAGMPKRMTLTTVAFCDLSTASNPSTSGLSSNRFSTSKNHNDYD